MASPESRELPAAEPSAPSAIDAPPCFFSRVCAARAAIEKTGRSVCRGCAARLRGVEYPLRRPSLEPLYFTGRTASEAMDMVED